MKKLLGILVTSTLLLSACGQDEVKVNNDKSKEESKGIRVVAELDTHDWRSVIKIEDEGTKCRYLIRQEGRMIPDLVQPKECKEKMESGE